MIKKTKWRMAKGSELTLLKSNLNLLLESYKNKNEELQKQFSQWEDNAEEGKFYHGMTEKEYVNELIADETYYHSKSYQVLFRSFIFSVFVYLEADLLRLCKYLCQSNDLPFSVKDLKGNGLKRSLTYLNKIIPSGFLKHNEDVSFCVNLRNYLAHGDYTNEEMVQKLEQSSKQSSFSLEIINSEIYINPEDLNQYIDFAEVVWSEITDHWYVEGF